MFPGLEKESRKPNYSIKGKFMKAQHPGPIQLLSPLIAVHFGSNHVVERKSTKIPLMINVGVWDHILNRERQFSYLVLELSTGSTWIYSNPHQPPVVPAQMKHCFPVVHEPEKMLASKMGSVASVKVFVFLSMPYKLIRCSLQTY